jgi:hypothetical protein
MKVQIHNAHGFWNEKKKKKKGGIQIQCGHQKPSKCFIGVCHSSPHV